MSDRQRFPLCDASGVYKRQPEDFEVIERLPFAPEGEGEHVFLRLCKRERNTRQVLQQLAELAFGLHALPVHLLHRLDVLRRRRLCRAIRA